MSGRIQLSFVDLVAFSSEIERVRYISGAKLVRFGRDRSLDMGCMLRLALFSFVSDLSNS
jgi:hypothetical protein